MLYRFFLVFIVCLCGCKESLPIAKSPIHQTSNEFIQSFHEGVRLKLKGNYYEAIDRFKACLEKQPLDDASHFALAQTYLLVGNLKLAEVHTLSALEADKNNLFYQVELAYMLRENGSFDEAAELFELISKSRIRNTEYYLAAIDCYKRAGNYSKAIKVIENLEKVRGNHLEAAIRKHRIYMEIGRLKEAEKVLLVFHKAHPKNTMVLASLVDFYVQNNDQSKALQMLKALVAEDPQNGMGFLMLAEHEYLQGNRKKAGDYFYKAILSENITVKETVSAFDFLVHHKEDERVEVCLEVLQRTFPDNDTIMIVLGDYYYKKASQNDKVSKQKALQESIINYGEALKINPNRFDLWQKLMYMHYDAKHWERLRSVAEAATRNFPLKPESYYFGSVACNQLEKYKRASELVDIGLSFIIDDPVLESDLLGQRGEAFFGMGMPEQAMVYYLEAIDLKAPTAAYLSFNLCMNMYQRRFKLEEALLLLEASEGFEQLHGVEDDSFYLLKADLLFDLERYDEAFYILNKIDVEETNMIIEVLTRKGDVCAKLMQHEKALYYWRQARQLGGEARKLIEKIETGRYVE